MSHNRKKTVRRRGKISLSRYFQNLEVGDKVSLKQEQSIQDSFPRRFTGRTAIVTGKQGKSYIVSFKDGGKEKRLVIHPIHLVKLKQNITPLEKKNNPKPTKKE